MPKKDWISWINKPPIAGHKGGVWERQIRTARSILNVLVKAHRKCLDNNSSHTFLVE